jgi:hypothetical protein
VNLICNNNTSASNAFYFIGSMIGNSLTPFSYNEKNQIYIHSNDFFTIRKRLRKPFRFISKYIKSNINKNYDEFEYIDEELVSFISSFTNGTVHGYTTIWEFIKKYKEGNFKCRILLSTATQSGILDLVTEIFGKDKIILIEPKKYYKIKKIHFIPISKYNFDDDFWDSVVELYRQYILKHKFSFEFKKIGIFKSNSYSSNYSCGEISNDDIIEFCKNNQIYNLNPTNFTEIENANILNNCEVFACSWGTAYYKNLRYIGDTCKNIYVFIPTEFLYEWNARKNEKNSFYSKFKNANVKYYTLDKHRLSTLKLLS